MNAKGFFNPFKLFSGKKLAARPPTPGPVSSGRFAFGKKEKVLGKEFSGMGPEEKHDRVSQALEAKLEGLETLEAEHELHVKAVEAARGEGEHEDAEKILRTTQAIRELIEVERKGEKDLREEREALMKKHPRLEERIPAPRPATGHATVPLQARQEVPTGRSKLERMLAEHPKLAEEKLREAERKVREAAQTYDVRPESLSEAERKNVLEELHTLPPGHELAEKAGKVAEKVEAHTAPLTVSYNPQPEGESTEDEGLDFRELANLKAKKDEVQAVYKDIEKHKIITDFDKILNYLRAHKKAKIAEMALALGIDRNRIMESLKTLEDSQLVEIVYPPIGAPIILYKEASTEGER